MFVNGHDLIGWVRTLFISKVSVDLVGEGVFGEDFSDDEVEPG